MNVNLTYIEIDRAFAISSNSYNATLEHRHRAHQLMYEVLGAIAKMKSSRVLKQDIEDLRDRIKVLLVIEKDIMNY